MITKDDMMSVLLDACPSFAPQWQAFKDEWREEDRRPSPCPGPSTTGAIRSIQGAVLNRAGLTAFREITFLAAGPASEPCRSATEVSLMYNATHRVHGHGGLFQTRSGYPETTWWRNSPLRLGKSLKPLLVKDGEPRLVALPTGDGMALGFLNCSGTDKSPLEWLIAVIEVAKVWGQRKQVGLRIGINCGDVEVIRDINGQS